MLLLLRAGERGAVFFLRSSDSEHQGAACRPQKRIRFEASAHISQSKHKIVLLIAICYTQ